jgi:nucleoside-diphosphate-sugar epimerase
MKKIVVTGSSGFIGRHVIDFLHKRNYEIFPLKLHLNDSQRNATQIKSIRAEYLLHFAWETTPGIYWHASTNLQWLKCSLDFIENFAIAGGERVVVAGSCAEKFPHTLYGASKEALRLTAAALLNKYRVSMAWGRVFFPYGPYEKSERLIPSLIQTLLSKEKFNCTSENHIRDFIFVEDAAEAFVLLLESDIEGIVDIGSGQGYKIGDVVQLIAQKIKALDRVSYLSSPLTDDHSSALIADPARLVYEAGFKPKYSLVKGIEKTVKWWKHEIHH